MSSLQFDQDLVEAETIMELPHQPYEKYAEQQQSVLFSLIVMQHPRLIMGACRNLTGQEIMALWDDETERQLEKRLQKKKRISR